MAIDTSTEGGTGAGSVPSRYFQLRLAPHPRRTSVWQHVCHYLQRWIPPESTVLELGAGRCDFANNVTAARSVAMDVDPIFVHSAAAHVEVEVGDCTDLSRFVDGAFSVVFASNLLEHLEREPTRRLLSEAARVLGPGGRLVLLQPNYRLNPGGYFDDYTHITIYTDRSLADYLTSEGWVVVDVRARVLPLTMRSRTSALAFLVPLYLRSPVKPFAGQMLVVATPGKVNEPA